MVETFFFQKKKKPIEWRNLMYNRIHRDIMPLGIAVTYMTLAATAAFARVARGG